MNAIRGLQDYGQSIWLDTISRDLITSGKLRRMIDEDGLLGMTSNPAIFEKAINGSPAYDPAISSLARQGLRTEEIYRALAVEDIRLAADLLAPVYERTNGLDGYISLEVSPLLARDTERTIEEGLELFRAVGRPNIFIKVPATGEGLPAIRALLARGVNVNVTLLFAVERYLEVAHAYLDGLDDLAARGGDVADVRSVASFFVSRIDTLADAWIAQGLEATSDAAQRSRLERLQGSIAIANAKIAYERYRELFGGRRFASLRTAGAHVQRLLWASTSTKNPAYPDVLYVDNLIGPDTVNTLPEETLNAFLDHGKTAATLERGVDAAHAVIRDFEAAGKVAGFSMRQLTRQLLDEGVAKFAEPFEKLLRAIEAKRAAAAADELHAWLAALGPHRELAAATLRRLDDERFAERLWAHDPTAWTADVAHHERIRNRLGWLTLAGRQRRQPAELRTFAEEVKAAGFRHAVLCGMGGSSLGPEVLRLTFGAQPGYPQLQLLDSTVPAQVEAMAASVDLAATLFIVSSKSGGTTETLSFCAYFYDQLQQRRGDKAGEHFVAITDPGSSLEELARAKGFRRIFFGEPQVGGRFSVLSNFGMAPAAVSGLDVDALLGRVERMMHRCSANVPCVQNPGIVLGVVLHTLAEAGRDKMTIVASPGIAAFGAWLEQLVAESLGKQGKGIIPLGDEPLGDAGAYGEDRLFVYLRLAQAADPHHDAALAALADAGHPVITIEVAERFDIGAQMYLWEIATVTVGALLSINAFDEPNVQESKDNTSALLKLYRRDGRLPKPEALLQEDGLTLYADEENRAALSPAPLPNVPPQVAPPHATGRQGRATSGFDPASLEGILAAHLARLGKGDYLAINAYVEQTAAHYETLQRLRERLRDAYHVATMLGFGPRFLHSTGQLHKGGPNNVVVLQLTCEHDREAPIPGEPYSFAVLNAAQALGDAQSLSSHKRRALRVHLGGVEGGLARFVEALETVIASKLTS